MATSTTVLVTPNGRPAYGAATLDPSSAKLTTRLLQENHDEHHIFFKPMGLHNHTMHHLLSLYALGGSELSIQSQYNGHKKNQRPAGELDLDFVERMHDPQVFSDCLAKQEHYHNWLQYFRSEIETMGYEKVVKKYLLSGEDFAEDLLTRCYAGFLHPLIHLGFALEFAQPALVAEALAQTALTRNYMAPFFFGAEKAASESSPTESRSLQYLLNSIRENEKLATAADWDDDNKIRDGILVRAPREMIDIGSQWTVRPEELEFRTAEMINAVVYYTMGAQHPPKQIKFDFYFMHCLNCSIFFSAFLKLSWLSQEDKIRLLEWKGRNDLVMYASRRAPKTLESEWQDYTPKKPGDWESLFARVAALPEDGHACKMLRALANGQEVCRPFEDREEMRVNRDTWLTFGHMLMDSVEDEGKTWVRSAGFDKAWDDFADRKGGSV